MKGDRAHNLTSLLHLQPPVRSHALEHGVGLGFSDFGITRAQELVDIGMRGQEPLLPLNGEPRDPPSDMKLGLHPGIKPKGQPMRCKSPELSFRQARPERHLKMRPHKVGRGLSRGFAAPSTAGLPCGPN